MAYGRLDVFWPEGKFETYILDVDNVTIGRHSDNVITLDSEAISRIHFCIRYDKGQVSIVDMDSANGTFVDGVRLKSNEPHILEGVEEILVGPLRILYHPVDDSPTLPMTSLVEETQRIEKEAANFKIDVQGPDIAVPPGSHSSVLLTITNTGETERRFVVQVLNMPKGWARVNRPELVVDPNDTEEVIVNFKPVRRSDSKPGEYKATIQVSPKDKPEVSLEATLTVPILAYSGFGVALAQRKLRGGDPVRLYVHNQGNDKLPIKINAVDKSGKLRFDLALEHVTLDPGQRMQITADVRPKSPALIGAPRAHAFDMVVQSENAAAFTTAVRGYLIESPTLPTWAAAAIGGVSVILVLIVALGLVSLARPPKPHIASFEVNSTQVAQGEPLALSWSATDSASFNVSVNGTPYQTDLNALSPGVEIDTQSLHGEISVMLEAINGDQTTSAVQQIFVYTPLQFESFTVEPSQLVRDVVQEISISWNVTGAVQTRIDGLDSFSNAPVGSTFGAEGSINGISGIPTGDFVLTLHAEDEAGNSQEQQVTVTVTNPECMPASGDVELRFGPDVRHNVVGTVKAGTTVTVDAQDGSGQWLRVPLAGNTAGWGLKSAFTCSPNFNPDALLVELNVPPTPTNTPTFTPVPPTSTYTPTPTSTPTETYTPVPSETPAPTATKLQTPSKTPIQQLSPTAVG